MALSSWVASHRHAALPGANEIQRLAIALGSIRSVVRVMDTHRPPMNVDWADSNTSYTDIPGGEIKINPAPMLDGTPDDMALDVAIGFGMHEAGHSESSRSIYDLLVTKQPDGSMNLSFRPTQVAAYLWNVVEDIRMEAVESRKWPGFAPYFDRVLDWLWGDIRKQDKLPKGYGDELQERLTFAFVACRFPRHADAKWNKGDLFGRPTKENREIAWWQAWRDRYLDGTDDPRVTIQSGLDHLAENSKKAREEMAEITSREERMVEFGRNITKIIEDILEEKFANAVMPCTGDHGEPEDQAINPVVAEQVKQLVREGLTESATPVPANGRAPSTILSRKPEEDRASIKAFVGRPDGTSEALRAALVFRPSAPEWTEKLLKSGELDDEELHRWAAGDYRVFSHKVVESKPDVLMGLLVDMSGSMAGQKLKTAQRLAQLFAYALHDQPGVETRVWGHTADVSGMYDSASGTTLLFTLWEPGDPMTRFGLIETLPHSNNADGHAIAWCADQMRGATQPQKVLFVLSDGRPSAYEYGLGEGEEHVAEVCRWSREHGVEVVQIAIDPGALRPATQERMFGPGGWVGYESDAALPRQLAALMARWS
jgi:hypothetical protein